MLAAILSGHEDEDCGLQQVQYVVFFNVGNNE